MIVADIWEQAKEILGKCDEAILLERLTDAVELLAQKGEYDPLVGYVDVRSGPGGCVTLPNDVDSVLQVNVGGMPTVFRNRWFEFHLNGPGSCGTTSGYRWDDKGMHAVFQDLIEPSHVTAIADSPADLGKSLRLFGTYFDPGSGEEKTLRSGGLEGLAIPINISSDFPYGIPVPDTSSLLINRVTRVVKDVTVGPVRLVGWDQGRECQMTDLGYYEPYETEPRYKRIQVGTECAWVRIRYRKRTLKLQSQHDSILVNSKLAVLFAARALDRYLSGDLEEGKAYELEALRLLKEKAQSMEGPMQLALQFDKSTSMTDRYQNMR